MDNRKFEKLIDLIINENEEQARELFHEIVVEKSRQIYESLMDEEDESMSMLDEIGADLDVEQSGGTFEDDEDMDMPLDDEDDGFADDEEIDLDADELDDMSDDEELEDRVVDLEEKLDQLMAEFEELMDQDDDMGDEDMDMGDEDMDMGDEDMDMDDEDMDMDDEDMEDDEDSLDESVQLQAVKKVSHGDNGAYTTSPTLTKPKVVATGAKPTAMGQGGEPVPNSAKAANNYATKGQGQLKGAGQFKNAPGHRSQDLTSAPKAKNSQESGVNTKSPVAESRRRAIKQQFGAKRK